MKAIICALLIGASLGPLPVLAKAPGNDAGQTRPWLARFQRTPRTGPAAARPSFFARHPMIRNGLLLSAGTGTLWSLYRTGEAVSANLPANEIFGSAMQSFAQGFIAPAVVALGLGVVAFFVVGNSHPY